MRARDLKKLKPGQKLLVRLSKLTLAAWPGLVRWNERIVYLHEIVGHYSNGEFEVRSSRRVRPSTQYTCSLLVKEVSVVHDLDTAVLSLRFNGRR